MKMTELKSEEMMAIDGGAMQPSSDGYTPIKGGWIRTRRGYKRPNPKPKIYRFKKENRSAYM